MALPCMAILLTVAIVFPGVSEGQADGNDYSDDDVTLMQLYMNDVRASHTKLPTEAEKGVRPEKLTETSVEPFFQTRKLAPSEFTNILLRNSTQYDSSHVAQGLRPEKITETKVEPRFQTQEVTPLELTFVMQRMRSKAVVSAAQTAVGGLALTCCVLVPVVFMITVILMSPSQIRSKGDGENKFELAWYHYVLFVAISMLGPMATDIILPAFPLIAESLHTSDYLTSLTMPVNMGVRGLSMVVIGSLSDRFGQKKMMLVSLVLFTGGSIICMKSSDIQTMLLGRVMQGSGEASDALVQAVVRTLIDEPHSRMRVLSVLQSLQPVFVIVAPLMGSVLTVYFGWRSIYCFLMSGAVLALIGYILVVPETRDESPKQPLLEQFASALGNKESWPFLVPCALIFVVLLSMLCNSAFVLEDFGASTMDKGLLIATMPPFVAMGAFITSNAFHREGQSLYITLRRAMGCTGLLLFSTFCIGMIFEHSEWLIMVTFYSITLSVGLCLPTLTTLYLEPLKDTCGLASGILVGAQNMSAALLVPFSADMLDKNGIRSMFMVFMTIHVVGQAVFWFGFGFRHDEAMLQKVHDDDVDTIGTSTLFLSKCVSGGSERM